MTRSLFLFLRLPPMIAYWSWSRTRMMSPWARGSLDQWQLTTPWILHEHQHYSDIFQYRQRAKYYLHHYIL